jgi:hypothetical protein
MTIAQRALAANLKCTVIDVPEWDAKVAVREMNAEDRVKFGEDAKKWPAVAMVRLLIASTFDPETGKAVFEPAHQDQLLKQSGSVVDRIVTEICRISGLTPDAAAEAAKN